MPIWTNHGSGWQLLATTGFPDEAALHSLVEQAPQILPLAGSPRLVVLGREVLLGNGYADLIAVEPTGRMAIIEVKLARNAEARRAIVAQVLTYAAYLNGLDPIVLERDILGRHLRDRGYADLAGAVAANDQEGSFDAVGFSEGLAESLARGQFRLVLVLDDAPEELARLIAYLEAVTADRLLIDLVTVASYRIGESEVIVPQRVEAERRPVEQRPVETRSATQGTSESAGKLVEGVEDFDASIAAKREEQRPVVQRLRDWAVALRSEGLVRLDTYHMRGGPNRLSLLPRLLDEGVGLVTIYNYNGTPSLQVFRRVFERRSPKALAKIEGLIAPETLGQGTTIRNISNELLETLTDAYREAVG
jgi:hypothetical protein